jgi:IS605 OrfB family transposase
MKNEQLVLPNNKTFSVYDYFNEYAQFFGRIERCLFVDLHVRKKPSNELKKHYCALYQITARQYNSIKNQIDGRVSAKVEKRKFELDELEEKIKQVNELLEKKKMQKEKAHISLLKMKGNEKSFLKKVKNYRSLRQHIHQKKRKMHALTEKLKKLKQDEKNGIVRLCFGSKEWFHKQFHLDENHLTFNEWKKMWQEKRASQFTFIGSKDETYGNQTCTYDLANNLRIRVSKKDEHMYGKYIVIPNVHFSYGQEQIDVAKVPTIGYTKGKGNQVNYYRALTHKFIRKDNKWYLNTTVDVDIPDKKTIQGNGYIGVDFNVNFLAVAEVDRFGNYLYSFQVPFTAYHVSSEQAKQSLSEALKIVVEYALEKQKSVVYEKLNFKQKKMQLKQMNKKQAKLLSGFAYSSYQTMMATKCEKAGVEHKVVHPAYTSQIGHHKFMKKYGLSSHESAAMVIARRGIGFKQIEKVPNAHIIEGNLQKVLSKKRIDQWKVVTKQWKKYTFKQKNCILYKAF